MPKKSEKSGLPTSPDNPSRMPVPPAEPAGPLNLKRTLPPEPMDIAAKRANHYFDDSANAGDYHYTHNCQRCVWATELRARGYDVEAMPAHGKNDPQAYQHTPESFLKVGDPPLTLNQVDAGKYRLHWDSPKRLSGKVIDEHIRSQYPDGSRGMIVMHGARSGHVINWELRDGKVSYYDGQVAGAETKGNYYSLDKASDIAKHYSYVATARMDNVGLNNNLISQFVRERKENNKYY